MHTAPSWARPGDRRCIALWTVCGRTYDAIHTCPTDGLLSDAIHAHLCACGKLCLCHWHVSLCCALQAGTKV